MTLIRSPGPSGRRRLCSTATRRLIGAAAISAIVVPQSLAQDSRTTAEIAAIAMRSTATIIALGSSGDTLGQGSGFVVRSDGVVVTNWHVVAGARRVVVILADQSPIEDVGALAGDSVLDLALLKLPGTGYEALGTDSLPRVGERVVVIGSPLGLSQTGLTRSLR